MTPEQQNGLSQAAPVVTKAVLQGHIDGIKTAKELIATKQVHPQSGEGKVLHIVLAALEFLFTVFHHSAPAQNENPAGLPSDYTGQGIHETEKQ